MRLVLLLLLTILVGCNKKDSSGWTLFKIPEKSHSSSNSFEWTRHDRVKFDVVFDSTAIYKTVDPVNQYDVNKLFGVSDGGLHVRNSARFGWRWVDNKLELMAFTHLNGVFHFDKICNVEIGKEYTCCITLGEDYLFECSDGSNIHSLHMTRWHPNVEGSRYYLWPYFGGDETAPHEITIKLKY